MPKDLRSFEYFQRQCFDNNIHNKLIEDITTINFENNHNANGICSIIKTLNFIFDQSPDSWIQYGEKESFGKIYNAKNGTFIDLDNLLRKVLDGTYKYNGYVGENPMKQKNIMTLSLLYLNNYELPEFDNNLNDLMFSLAIDDNSNSQNIIWSLLAILDKAARGEIKKEILPAWLPISFISTSNTLICEKIISSLTPIAERFPNIFFKKSEFEQFWSMATDDSKAVEVGNAENLKESLFVKLTELVYTPVFINEPEMIQNVTTIFCGIFDSWNIYYLDNSFLLQNFLDILNVVTSEKSVCDVLRSIDAVLAALHSYDYRSVIDRLAESAGRNRNIVSYCRREKFTKISEILSKFPYLDSPEATLEVEEKFSRMKMSPEQEEDMNTILALKMYFNILNTSGQSIPALSNATEHLMINFRSRNLAKFENFLELQRDILNGLIRKNHLKWLYEMLSPYPEILALDIRVMYHEAVDQKASIELLSECLQKYQEPTVSREEHRLIESIMKLSLSLRVDEIEEEFQNLAGNYEPTINEILCKTTNWPQAGAFCSMFLKYNNLLWKVVKRRYVESGQIQLPAMEVESILEDILDSLSSKTSEETIFQTLASIDTFLGLLGGSISESNKLKLVKFAEMHKLVMNVFLRTGSPHNHLLSFLLFEPNILEFNNKLECIITNSNTYSKEFFDNFASECLGEIKYERRVEKIGRAVISLARSVKMSRSEFGEFIEKHKLLMNSTLRSSEQLELFVMLLPYRSKMDKDVRAKHLKIDRLNPTDKRFLLEGILLQLNGAVNKESAAEFLPTVENLFGSFEQLYCDFNHSRNRFIGFAKKNTKILNELLLENEKTFKNGAILRALSHVSRVLNFDVKVMYVDTTVSVLNYNELFELLSDCIGRIETKDSVLFSQQLKPIKTVCQVLSSKMFSGNNTRHWQFASQHHKTIEDLLYNSQVDFGSNLFTLLIPFPQFYGFDMKIKFINSYLSVTSKLYAPTDAEKLHWELLEECMNRHIYKKPKVCMAKPMNEILRKIICRPWKPADSHIMFVVKYETVLNDIISNELVPSIVDFLTYLPHFMNFNNKMKYLSAVLKQSDATSFRNVLQEFLKKLKSSSTAPNVLEICSAVKLIISSFPYGKTNMLNWITSLKNGSYDITEGFSDGYITELKKVVELVGFDKGPAWKVILTKLGISYLDFDTKVKNLREQLRRERRPLEVVRLEVNRSTVFPDSYDQLNSRSLSAWKSHFRIKFANENGIDAGGLMREWFTILTREIFNPNYALFTTASDDNNSYTINKASHVNPEHLDYFKFVGRFIGKCIMEKQFVDCSFTKSLYKHILNIPVNFKDFEAEEPIFCSSLKTLLDTPISELGLDLTFSTNVEEFDIVSEKELKPNGKNIEVTDENKAEYVQLLYQMKMTGSIRKQRDSFLRGFYDMIPKHLITVFTVKELELLICGEPEIDVNDLEANTKYENYQKSDVTIQWFWRAARSFDKNDKARLLMFVTGSSKAPPGGFASNPNKFAICRSLYYDNRLPTAHTCAHQLVLPQYCSYEKLRKSLLTAIRECSEGFGFS